MILAKHAVQTALLTGLIAAAPAIRIPYERYTLPNGLTVVLAPDHSAPMVTVDVVYHVGSSNEVAGHAGFAHLFEHVMFTGSAHVPYGTLDRYTGGAGGTNNGATGRDYTEFYDSAPANYLEIALWIESDRMGFLLDSLDETKLRTQRDIVQNERRRNYDNKPYARDYEVLNYYMYGAGQPYSRMPIGEMGDLQAASVEDVKEFFRTYYTPNNATLVVAGDFNPSQTKKWIAKYFAGIPRGDVVKRPASAIPTLTEPLRITLEDRVQVPQLTLQWPSASAISADHAALDVLSDILGNSRTARITKALVYDRQSAAAVTVYQNPSERTGEFQIILTPSQGHTLSELETQTDSILEQIKRDGPAADELKRVKAGQAIGFLTRLQSNQVKAQQLGADETLHHNPVYSVQIGFARSQAVTAADVQRVAQKYLGRGRVVLSTVPVGKPELASHADQSKLVTDPFALTIGSGGI